MRRSMFALWAALLVLGCVAPMRADGDSPADAARQREQAVTDGLPARLSEARLAELPVDATALTDGLGTLVVPKPYLPTRVTEPQHGWAFSRIAYVYGAPDADALSLFCRVHYTTAGDAALAARMGSLLALAHWALTTETGRAPANGSAPFDVWLCRGGHTGGEQWRSHLYFYDLDAPRSSIEWIREIVHEYAHLALPPVGGYDAPEYWANGYLGERLIVRWLQRLPDGPARVARAWGDFSGAANFDRLLVAPALALYDRVGPSAKWLRRRDAEGMRYLIGLVLTWDDRHGARALGRAFALLPRFREARATDVADALHGALAGRGRTS